MLGSIKGSTLGSDYYNSTFKIEGARAIGGPESRQAGFSPINKFTEIIGRSASLHSVLQAVETVAPTDASVLIMGETGTGKELIAKAIHRLSRRSNRAFVKMNSAAIPATLLEAELFGHERGAFTGATNHRAGRFELADKGTLFLDEIGDLPLELQPKLLRVLQEQEFERLGGMRTIKTNVRIVAATNHHLHDRVEEGKFRSDLYYRLNVFPVVLPPLRERRDDIPFLANHFAQKFAHKMSKEILPLSADTIKFLMKYDYPGNVRELENIIERAVILARSNVLQVKSLELTAPSKKQILQTCGTLEDFERRFILQVLNDTNWRIGGLDGAAVKLGLKRTTLISKLGKLGISRQSPQYSHS